MEERANVHFRLFGQFRILVGATEVEFPDAAFFTYLKLLLLSGEPNLNNTSKCLLGFSKGIRDVVDKGNSSPKPTQGGRYDFSAKTGLSLRYREGLGLELRGDEWMSDVIEFERIWSSLGGGMATDDQLQHAFELYGQGVNVRTWKRDRVLIDCEEWVNKRLQELETHRNDISRELEARRERAVDGMPVGDEAEGGQSQRWNGEKTFSHVTSGFEGPEDELNLIPKGSTTMRQDLLVDEVGESRDEVERNGSAASPQADYWKTMRELNEARLLEDDTVSEDFPRSGDTSAQNQTEPVKVLLPLAQSRRTITPLAILVALVVASLMFLAGYLVGYVQGIK